jgi:hypothetical protein
MRTSIQHPSTTVISSSTEIVCPPWCTVSAAEHLEDLPNWEGTCIHRGTIWKSGEREVELVSVTLPNGALRSQDGAATINVHVHHEDQLTAADARAMASALISAADSVQSLESV